MSDESTSAELRRVKAELGSALTSLTATTRHRDGLQETLDKRTGQLTAARWAADSAQAEVTRLKAELAAERDVTRLARELMTRLEVNRDLLSATAYAFADELDNSGEQPTLLAQRLRERLDQLHPDKTEEG